MRTIWTLTGVVVLGLLVERGRNIYKLLQPMDPMVYNDDNCQLVGSDLIPNSEDVSIGKHSVLFVSVGDLWTAFHEGSESAQPGGVWIYNLRDTTDQKMIKVEMKGFPKDINVQGHGMYVSNKTDHLYLISHRGPESVVEVFKIEYKKECLAPTKWSCKDPVVLNYITSVRAPEFISYGINDLVEGSYIGEIYVSKWQIFPYPTRGMNNPETLMEKIQPTVVWITTLLGIKLTTVYRCTWTPEGDSKCAKATDTPFIGANGVAVSQDRSTVYVSDPISKSVIVFSRGKDGSLTFQETIDLPFMADNLEIELETGNLLMGTVPDITKTIERLSDESVSVPGGLAVAKKAGTTWHVDHVLLHAGDKMSQISDATRHGSKHILGSPYAPGILVCQL